MLIELVRNLIELVRHLMFLVQVKIFGTGLGAVEENSQDSRICEHKGTLQVSPFNFSQC
jgi:hypothetical protein